MREVQLPNAAWGKIYLHSMPGRWEGDIDTFVQNLATRHVECIVCLAPRREIEKKSPKYHEAIVSGTLPVPVLEFGIPDFGIPEDADSFASLVQKICEYVERGKNVLIHCGGGIGRTGMVAQCVLLALGLSKEEASTAVKQAGSHAETRNQKRFVEDFQERLAGERH